MTLQPDQSSLVEYFDQRTIGHQPFRSTCFAPFNSLSFDSSGLVSVCAASRSTPLGYVGRTPLEELWRGAAIKEFRTAHSEHRFPAACARCAIEIRGGNTTGVVALGFDRFPVDQPERPRRLEFALSTSCNLECVMCNGEFSSAIRSNREGLPLYRSPYDGRFIDEVTPFLVEAHQARFLGGEPFLADINHQIWERMAAASPDIDVNVTTNGTVWSPRVERALSTLNFSIGVSIDGVSQRTVESIRRGARHEQIMRNLRRFLEYRDRGQGSVSLTFCLMIANWTEFADFLAMGDRLGCDVYVNTVTHPTSMSLYHLDQATFDNVVSTLEAANDRESSRLDRNRHVWESQLRRLIDHRQQRRTGASGLFDGSADRWNRLAAEIAAAGPSSPRLTHAMEAATGSDVSTVEIDVAGALTSATTYLGFDVDHLVGFPASVLTAETARRHGAALMLVGEAIANRTVVRVTSFESDQGAQQLVVTATAAHSNGGTVRLASLVDEPIRGSDQRPVATPVVIGRAQADSIDAGQRTR